MIWECTLGVNVSRLVPSIDEWQKTPLILSLSKEMSDVPVHAGFPFMVSQSNHMSGKEVAFELMAYYRNQQLRQWASSQYERRPTRGILWKSAMALVGG